MKVDVANKNVIPVKNIIVTNPKTDRTFAPIRKICLTRLHSDNSNGHSNCLKIVKILPIY